MEGRIILIPSYGTDSTLYSNLKLETEKKIKVLRTEWIPVTKDSDLQTYVKKFIATYRITSKDILIGTSLGGILSIEINKQIPVHQIISISSILTKKEQPKIFRIIRTLHLYHLWPPTIAKMFIAVIIPFYGKNADKFKWFQGVFRKTDNTFLKWAFKHIILWENDEIPENLIHIHGQNDPLFPLKNALLVDYVIKNGTHAMIRFKANEIGKIIDEILLKD
jgi:esterase/lipase